jgi:hypothetical protein
MYGRKLSFSVDAYRYSMLQALDFSSSAEVWMAVF